MKCSGVYYGSTLKPSVEILDEDYRGKERIGMGIEDDGGNLEIYCTLGLDIAPDLS